MALRDHAPFSLAGDRPASSTPPLRRSSNQHNEPRSSPEDDRALCNPLDVTCLCSFASRLHLAQSRCSRLTAGTHTGGATTPDTSTPHTLVPTSTSPLTSPNSHSATSNAGTPPPSPRPTPIETIFITNGPGSSRSIALSAVPSSSVQAPADHPATSSLMLSSAVTGPSGPSPASSNQHQLNTGTIIAIVLSALAVILASALALFFFCRHGRGCMHKSRRKSRRMSAAERTMYSGAFDYFLSTYSPTPSSS